MSKAIPVVSKYMTTVPHTANPGITLAEAAEQMRQRHIRHLPILDGGQLAGLLSERDIRVVEALKDVDPRKIKVEEAMTQDVYVTSPDTPLDEVVAEMAGKKYGSVVVMQNQKVVGIFTAVDAMLALSELLHTRLARG